MLINTCDETRGAKTVSPPGQFRAALIQLSYSCAIYSVPNQAKHHSSGWRAAAAASSFSLVKSRRSGVSDT